jgi:hypothetical protein
MPAALATLAYAALKGRSSTTSGFRDATQGDQEHAKLVGPYRHG